MDKGFPSTECSFFYVKNLGMDVDHVNLPSFDAGGHGEHDN
jgi:hypothetical protein